MQPEAGAFHLARSSATGPGRADRRRGHRCHGLAIGGLQHLVLAGEVMADQAAGDAGTGRDLAYGCALQSLLRNAVQRCPDQVLPPLRLPGAMEDRAGS